MNFLSHIVQHRILKRTGDGTTTSFPFHHKPISDGNFASQPFMNEPERRFFRLLSDAMGPEFVIWPKARLSDVVSLQDPSNNLLVAVTLSKRHIPYLICDASSMEPRVAVYSEQPGSRADRMLAEKTDRVLQRISLPTVRFSGSTDIPRSDIRDRIEAVLHSQPSETQFADDEAPISIPFQKELARSG